MEKDFDGDQMNLVLLLDNDSADKADANLAPHKNMLEINSPRELTNVARHPKPVASTIAHWLDNNDATNEVMDELFISEMSA